MLWAFSQTISFQKPNFSNDKKLFFLAICYVSGTALDAKIIDANRTEPTSAFLVIMTLGCNLINIGIRGCSQWCLIDCAIMLEVSIACDLDFFM